MSNHLVTRPREPFLAADGALEVHQIPAWTDNLIWVAVCTKTGEAAVVDGPEAQSALAYCEQRGINLTSIINTHTHPDHVGVNQSLQDMGVLDRYRVFGPRGAANAVPGITDPVDEGDTVRIGAVEGRVMRTEGHQNGHTSYVFGDVLFSGDTLFAAGCGYLFDGPPAKMYDSLTRLAALDKQTLVCCAHEYTQDNLRFAWSVEPDNDALVQRIREDWAIRADGGCTVPSRMATELATNPFLRSESRSLRDAVAAAMPDRDLDSPLAVFTATRALKDRKDYRRITDAQLPLAGTAEA